MCLTHPISQCYELISYLRGLCLLLYALAPPNHAFVALPILRPALSHPFVHFATTRSCLQLDIIKPVKTQNRERMTLVHTFVCTTIPLCLCTSLPSLGVDSASLSFVMGFVNTSPRFSCRTDSPNEELLSRHSCLQPRGVAAHRTFDANVCAAMLSVANLTLTVTDQPAATVDPILRQSVFL